MNKKNLLFIFCFIGGICISLLWVTTEDYMYAFFTGEKAAAKELWIAKKTTHAHSSPFDDTHAHSSSFNENALFKINENDICTPIKTLTTKDIMYINVLCKNGQGWIVGRVNQFDMIKTKESSQKTKNLN
jgi:hypothetical protein